MATRRQKQLQRKYSSYRRYTAAEDVNYLTHSSRSSFRSESVTSRTNERGRSSSTELVTGSETRSLPVFIAIQDYTPDNGDPEAIPLEQGQIVEVLDNTNPTQWLVRTKARPPQTGWVPGSYFETPSNYYTQRRQTRELMGTDTNLTEEQEAVLKREQVYHDLLQSEEEFAAQLHILLDHYVRPLSDAPDDVQTFVPKLTLNLRELWNFHSNVLLKGLQYYSDDPGKVGQTFIRLEKDFEKHVRFCRELPNTLKLIEQNPDVANFLQSLSDKLEAGSRSFIDYLHTVPERISRYEAFFKEIVKYSARAKCSTKSVQKALELVQSIPKRAAEAIFTTNIVEYPGDINSLGRIYRHNDFQMWEADDLPTDRHIFLFRNKLVITEMKKDVDPPMFQHCFTIRLDKYSIRQHTNDEDSMVFRALEAGLPTFRIKGGDLTTSEIIRKAWLKEITEMQETLASETLIDTDTYTLTDLDVRSEFSEYSTISRKSSAPNGPEEGPPRKKIKSPPAISPTGSSTSLYSGGSSIDWTATGTTLDMQGTRVTRTQYGFRTLQESSAKMCLKVTGYPLPEITWYKDDVLLKEDERRTFYADDDGFFAMTIDPVQVTDTGRYTCVATNEYGQASTSAYFKVLKLEKEAAPPAFVNNLLDQTCKEGDVVNFECEVEGWPEPELVWLVDDQPLRPSQDFRLQYDGQSAKLEIRDAQPEDTGTYAIRITNEYGTKETNAKLVVEADPDKNHVAPEFQATAEDVDCNEGDTVRFKAVLTGDPEPEVTWFVNGVPLTESEKVKFISEDGICIVTIQDVSRHFDGTVTCQGKNRLGTSSCDARLRVRVPPLPPQFDKALEDRVVTEGSAVMFDVDVSGYPEPKVEFFLKGKKLENGIGGVEIQQRDSYYKVTIQKCSIDGHDGEIVARATNEHGQAESRSRLTVEPEEEESRSAPTFLKDIEDQTVKFGENATFESVVRGTPNPVVSWFINGQKLDSSSPGVQIEANGPNHKLIIDSSKYAGTVLCRAENPIGRFETSARLIVLPLEKKKKAPEFTEPLKDKTELENGTAVFEVTVDAEPKAQLQWTFNGQPITENEKFKFREFDGSSKLEIHNLGVNDGGVIGCIATNSEGRAETKCVLSIQRKQQKPQFDQKPQNQNIPRGQKAVFTAHADAVPNAEYTWLIDGKKVWNSTEGTTIETDINSGTTKLIIDTGILPNAATVTVVAENKLGTDESFALLIVNEPIIEPSKVSIEEKLHEQGQETTSFQEPQKLIQEEKLEEKAESKTDGTLQMEPIVQKTTISEKIEERLEIKFGRPLPAEIRIKETETLQLEVNAENAKNFKWSLNDRILANEFGIEINTMGETSKLKVENIRPDLNGAKISVIASNETAQAKTEGKLVVEPKGNPPEITKSPQSRSVGEHEVLSFAATIIGKPTSVEWTVNNQKVTLDSTDFALSQSGDEYILRINDSAVRHAGEVKVTASNQSGSVSATATLSVAKRPNPRLQSQLPATVEAKEGQPLQLSIAASDADKIQWSLNGEPLQDGVNGVHITTTPDGSSKLRVDSVSPLWANGTLGVKAINSSGDDSSSATVNLSPKDVPVKITDWPKGITVTEGNSAEFKAQFVGVPKPTVKWIINGEEITQSKEGITVTESNGESTIRIQSASASQSGIVEIRAANDISRDSASAQLEVKKVPKSPIFRSQLSDQSVAEGSPLRFQVEIENPTPDLNVQWLLNGNPLGPEAQIIDAGNGRFQLVIPSAKSDFNGTLTVKAQNSVGDSSSSAKVTVSSSKQKPEFTKEPQEHRVEEGAAGPRGVKFSAVVTGSPTPNVIWSLQGKQISSSEEIRVKFDTETGKTSIRIFKPTVAQSGIITVKAENELGTAEASAQLTVDRKREIPNFLTDMNDRQIHEGEAAKFVARIAAFPEPEVEWFLNGNPIAPIPNAKATQSGDTYTLELSNVQLNQAGEISCQAKNSLGTKRQNAQLAVREIGQSPIFLRNLEDRLIEERERLVMEAQLDTKIKPKATVKWFKDGTEFQTTEKMKVEYEESTGVFRLTIPNAELNDKCRIMVKAENSFGSAETSANIGVKKRVSQTKPQFLSPLGPLTITEGDSLNAKVIISGDPIPYAKWYINGQLVCQTEDTEIKNQDGVYSLTIHGCTTDMSGTIKCVAGNRMGEAQIEGKLTVISPIPVEFETSLCDATCREGDTLKLKAVLLGEPMPDVTWFVNGKKLVESQNVKIHAEKGTYTVTIKDITCDYSGKVVCEAVNEYGRASSEAMLLVLPRGEPPDFLEWLSNVRARQGSKVEHKVVFTGDPKPVLTWFINNKEMKDGIDGISIKTDDSTSVLIINNFNPDIHCGEIICKAENDAGEVSCTANMGTYTSDMVSESESDLLEENADEFVPINEEDREEIQRTPTPVMAPKFITKIKDTRANRGHQAIFECVVPDTKGVCCKWLKDGKEIELIARIRVQQRTIEGFTTNELIIDDVNPEDAGKYTVVVENPAGTDRCEANLTVIETFEKKEEQKAPEFIVQLGDQSGQPNATVTFQCKAIGEPKPTIKWLKDDQPLSQPKAKTEETPDGIQKLIIESIQPADQGVYKCVAENVAGKAETKAVLSIKARAPEFIRPLNDQSLKVGEQLILECSVTGEPQPSVEFYSDSVRLQTGGRVSIQHDATNTHWRLVIRDTQTSDFHEYRAEAHNTAGRVQSKCSVTPKGDQKPKIIDGLKQTKGKEGQPVEMSVRVAPGGIPPNVEWFRDGQKIIPDDKFQISDDGNGKYSLKIVPVGLADAGEYSVRISNPDGSDQSSAPLTVEPKSTAPSFAEPLKDQKLKEGETGEMKVVAIGEPQPEVRWLKDGKPLEADGSHILRRDSATEHTLVIKNTTPTDAAKYSATATNPMGTATTAADLSVIPKSEAPQFVEKLQKREIKANESAEMSCRVIGEPKPQIQWTKNGAPLNVDGNHISIREEPNGRCTLIIRDAKETDEGIYVCSATNSAGADKTEAPIQFAKQTSEPEPKAVEATPTLQTPKFIEPLTPQEIKPNESVTLRCRVNPESNPEIRWYKGDQPVQPSANISIEKVDDGTLKLTIRNATKEDVGLYRCEAVNSAGAAKTEAPLRYAQQMFVADTSEEFIIAFDKNLSDQFASKGSSVVFECKLSEETAKAKDLEIKWTKNDGEAIPLSNSKIEKTPEGILRLYLNNISADDAAPFKCTIRLNTQSVWTNARLHLTAHAVSTEQTGAEGAPEFVELLKSATTTVGGTATLHCKVRGTPRPTIKWTKRGVEILPSSHIQLEYLDDGTITLTVKDAQFDDSDEYRCEAENDFGSAWTEGPIAVVAEGTLPSDGEAPDFVEPVRPVTVRKGEDAVFSGRLTGIPKPDVKWFKNDVLVKPSEQIQIESLPDGTQKLILRNVTEADAGANIRCTATNKWGDVWSDATLTVQVNTPPTVIKALEEIKCEENEKITMKCAFSGVPIPELKWFKGPNEITGYDTRFKISSNGEGATELTISPTELRDTAMIRCEATNSSGNAKTEATLTVVQKESPPKFLKELEPIETSEGKGCVFECQIAGLPQPTIQWFKDGQPIGPTDGIRIENLPNGTSRLIIDRTKLDDQGNYRVEATNPNGTANSKAPLTVKPSQRLRLKRGLEDQTLDSGVRLQLSVEVEGKPKTVKWFKDNAEITASGRQRIQQITDEIYRLEVENSSKEDGGSYRVVLSNDAESIESSCKITIRKKAPTFTKGLSDQNVPIGDPIELEIEVEGEPSAVQWFKDGKSVDLNRAQIKDLGNGKYALRIPESKADDFGEYSVKVSNDGGEAKSSAKITEAKPSVQKPKITDGLKAQSVPAGQDAVFEAKVDGYPIQSKWYKNGNELQSPKTQNDGNAYRLIVPSAQKEDEADYTVRFSNDAGEDSSSAALTVKLPPIRILRRLSDLESPLGSKAVLEIETDQKPKQIKWYRNGEELSPSSKSQPQSDGKIHKLLIPNVEMSDEGNFKVLVLGDDGTSDESSCALTVKLPAETPGFKKGLSDMAVPINEPLELQVETTGSPETIKWAKDGIPVGVDGRVQAIKVNDNVFQLRVPKATKEDDGKYSVEISNPNGNAKSEGKITVEEPIEFLRPLSDQTVIEGERVEFLAETNVTPYSIKWYKNGTEIRDERIQTKSESGRLSLVISRSEKNDEGEYKVVLSNSCGTRESKAKLNVQLSKTKSAPRILDGLEDSIVAKGDQLVFEVTIDGDVDEIKWLKNGQPLGANARIEKIGDNTYRLTIPQADVGDAGDYSVEASNSAGKCVSNAKAEVDEKPSIVEGLVPANITEGDEQIFRVKVSTPIRQTKWYKNGNAIYPPQIVISKISPTEYELRIPSAALDDSGDYKVVLSNRAGECESTAPLKVSPKEAKEKPKEEEKPKEAEKPSGKAAVFTSPLSDLDLTEGEDLRLKCKVDGEPQPTVKWYRNGQQLSPDGRTIIELAPDGTATLLIKNAQKSDAGQFSVTATNPSGTAESQCQVTVRDAIPKAEPPEAPKFVIPLKATESTLGAAAEFVVKVRGNPKPTLRFTLNGKPLSIGGRISLEEEGDGQWKLTIKDVQEADFGIIRCIAENENGTADCEAKFGPSKDQSGKEKEAEGYAPRFNVPLWDRRLPAGQPMSIECHVDAKPSASIQWFYNGKPVGDNVEVDNSSDGGCRLKIRDWKAEAAGVYKCVATNEYGTAETESKLSIEEIEQISPPKETESAPKFNPGLEDQTIVAGETLRLKCSVFGTPQPSVIWHKDGLPLRVTDRIAISFDPDSGDCSLTIADTKAEDQGTYRCVASNKHGSTNTAALATIKAPKVEQKKEGEEPVFIKGLVDQWIDRGETLVFNCKVTGDPQPEIKWYRNGTLLRPSNRIQIDNSPDGSCSLTIKDCTMSDEGVYRCEAENSVGRAKTQANAHVDMLLSKADSVKIEEGIPPKFVIPLEDMSVRLGTGIELYCKVTGQPMPQLKWSKDGNPLREDHRFEWDNDEKAGTYRLRIRDSTLYDEGTYRCVASNESGSATTKSFVKLDDGKTGPTAAATDRAPKIAVRLSDVRVTEGQPLVLECRIDASPLPEVIWYKDGEKVIPSDRIQISLSPDGTAKLSIPSSTLDDDGIYRIIATNSAGTAHDKCTATVKKAPKKAEENAPISGGFDASKAPKVITPLESVRVPEKQSFTLRCKFAGEPKLTIKWFKDGERVYSYAHCRLTENPDGECILEVDSATRADAGCYRCVAENEFGNARTTGEVTVVLKERQRRSLDAGLSDGNAPGFTIPLTMKKAQIGESVTLECLPYGKPFPSIKWMKDGIELTPGENLLIESLPDGTQKLTVPKVDILSEGYYRCVATNEHGTASTKAELRITGDRHPKAAKAEPTEPEDSKPRIRPGLFNQSVHEGESVAMQICAQGWPTPTVQWFKDGQPLSAEKPEDGRRVVWTDERGFHHLAILTAQPDDEGEYSVVATNPHGEARSVGTLSVIMPRTVMGDDRNDRGGMPFPPGFIRQLKNKHVFTHLPTIFDCLVVGYPPPDVEWFHNGKLIIPNDRIKIQSCAGGSHALLITDTNVDDAGEYVAIAKNCHGTASSSAILDVTVPHLDEIKFDGSFDVTPYLVEEFGFRKINFRCLPTPPDYGPFIKEVTGHYLTLSWIPTKRSPPRYPQVTYVIEIRELPYKEWTLLDYNIPEPVCKVRNLELGKSYQFRVRAENIYGISDPSPASPPSRLMAPPPPVLDKNKRVIPLLDPYTERALDLAHAEQYSEAPWFAPGAVEKRYCAENDSLSVTFCFAGYPDPKIQWKFRGWDVDTTSPTSNTRVSTYAGTETTLTINGFSKNNAGQYQCVAINPYGEAQQNVHIDLATRPTFLQSLTDRVFGNGKPIRLDVRLDGNPVPEVKWTKEWHPLVESHRIKMISEGPYLRSLVITDPMWRDSGIYSCVAYNDAGQSSSSCSVTVEEEIQSTPKRRRKTAANGTSKSHAIYEIPEEEGEEEEEEQKKQNGSIEQNGSVAVL